MSSTGPFVINLCSSTTPMALEQPKLGELKQRFTFFVSRRREDGRERFRLHMGYFETENEAEEWLAVVRDIYPGAWTGEAPGKRLREREAAAAAASTLPAPSVSVPQPPAHVLAGIAKLQSSETATRLRTPPAAAALDARRSEAAASSEFSVTFEPAPPAAAPAFSVPKPDLAPIMLAPPLPASAPDVARSALVAASASAQAAVRMASSPPVLVVPTLQEAPELPPLANIPVLNAPMISAPVLKAAPTAAAASAALSASTVEAALAVNPAPALNAGQPASPVMLTAPKVTPPVFAAPVAQPATPVVRAPVAAAPAAVQPPKPVAVVAKAPVPAVPVVKQAAKAAPPAIVKSAPKAPAPRAAAPRPAPVAPPPAQPVQAAPTTSTNSLSNVAEVLASLDETGQTRQMPVLPSQATLIQQTVVGGAPASSSPSMSDTQILKYLENRRADGSTAPASSEGDDGISMLRPDDTGTVRALKEAVTTNQPVAFAVQLKWSVQPIELSEVPPLAIFSAYTLYTVEGSREGRKWFGLRLGFFTDAISAKQVAYYVRSEFASVAVVPVSPQERGRATDAGKNAAVTRTASPPPPPKKAPVDEFKLIDTIQTPALPAAPPPPARSAVAAAPVPKPQPAPKASPAPKRNAKSPGKVRARDRRTPQSLEETLEILGADQLEIDNGRGERLNDTGVRHLKVSVQKNSPFSRLLDRLSERVNKS